MQLTKHTDFAFRILIYLASTDEKLTRIQQLADGFDISKSHVMKIVNKLVHHGWVASVRGKNGGICLGSAPQDVRLNDVVVLMEQTLEPVNCKEPLCALTSACKLKGVLLQAQDEYLAHLAQFTLADLVDREMISVVRMIE